MYYNSIFMYKWKFNCRWDNVNFNIAIYILRVMIYLYKI